MSTATTTKVVTPESIADKPMRVIGPHQDGTYTIECDVEQATLDVWVAQAADGEVVRINREQIVEAARQAVAQLRTVRDAQSMTTAQAQAAIKALARNQILIIRLLVADLDGTT